MPPAFKFAREEIIQKALEITRSQGMKALTARSLAIQLGSSPKPIFGLFENMEEVQRDVITAANGEYEAMLRDTIEKEEYPAYKASGMGYIRFAKEEPELFKLLFMRDRTGETIEESREAVRPQLNMIMKNLGVDEDTAYLLHIEMWIYVHGVATMIATSYLDWDMEFVSKSLTRVYEGLKCKL